MKEPLLRDDVLTLLFLAVQMIGRSQLRAVACAGQAVTALRAYAERQRFEPSLTAFALEVEAYARDRMEALR